MSFTQSGTVATLEDLRLDAAAVRELHEALYNRTAHWSDWDQYLTCADRQEVAVEESFQAMKDADAAVARAEREAA